MWSHSWFLFEEGLKSLCLTPKFMLFPQASTWLCPGWPRHTAGFQNGSLLRVRSLDQLILHSFSTWRSGGLAGLWDSTPTVPTTRFVFQLPVPPTLLFEGASNLSLSQLVCTFKHFFFYFSAALAENIFLELCYPVCYWFSPKVWSPFFLFCPDSYLFSLITQGHSLQTEWALLCCPSPHSFLEMLFQTLIGERSRSAPASWGFQDSPKTMKMAWKF